MAANEGNGRPMREKGGGEGERERGQDVTYLQAKMDDSDEPALYLRANSCHLSGGRVVTVNTRQWPLFVRRYPFTFSIRSICSSKYNETWWLPCPLKLNNSVCSSKSKVKPRIFLYKVSKERVGGLDIDN